ncbi:MAG: 50S ribosomal protein L6 [Peptococcaceae bacterium]|nr:50S ribosomal protein L6 [Peptococcaceae bacterium]
MSRIGRSPISIPQGVDVAIDGNTVKVKGPKGELSKELPRDIKLILEDGRLVLERPNDEAKYRALHGLTRSLVANMVEGVSKGYQKVLELVGVGYRAAMQGNKLVLSLGYSHPIEYEPPAGIQIEVPTATQVVVKGADKELVGAVASEIRQFRPPEPYKGKGIRYQGEYIRRKAGKAAAKK